ncbi:MULTISPECIES: hypothetical protein [unclassified Rhizobium]|nr:MULTISPECIES: hypothetical protein [unclassified Rhizobium]MDH7809514.1 hydroxypyruvate isomerase [Rhizobium sp. AN67]SOD50437.1 hydroxypyruvate isomerase [Rhizobium sp. AN6A]
MEQPFILAACVEMLWRDKPIEWRCAQRNDLGFGSPASSFDGNHNWR